jgi:cobalt-zinc-cadmium efflux system membrane fusion protein
MFMKIWLVCITTILLAACGSKNNESHSDTQNHAEAAAEEPAKGPHRGRMLVDGDFAIELAIFESGVPPEYHAWPTLNGTAVPLDQVDLSVELLRLDGEVNRFNFSPQEDYLRGDGVVTEPHSFVVKVTAAHAGKTHTWTFDSFEGRTTIAAEIAKNAGITTELAGPATLTETLELYGRIAPDPSRQRQVSARFPGLIRTVLKKSGDKVQSGDALATIESNESLETYTLTAPITGMVTMRDANPGEQSGDRALFIIIDPSSVWAELSVFPRDRARIRTGAAVDIKIADSKIHAQGKIERIDVQAGANQAVTARVTLDNTRGLFLPGTFITADIAVAERSVPLAVKTAALQPFRDFTVVFEQVGQTYEVRMLELGETQGDWAEVLGGLKPGALYVTENSYIIKADIEKSGASHDH